MLYKPVLGAILNSPLKGYEFIVRINGTVIFILFPSTFILSAIITKLTTYFFANSKNFLSTVVSNKDMSPLKGDSKGNSISISSLITLVALASKCHSVLTLIEV